MFLDLDPEKGIVAGQSWERTLYRKLRACRAVVALCTDHYLLSHWCFAEIALARMEGKHIIAIQAEPLSDSAKMPAILTEKQLIDLRHGEEEGYRRLWRSLKELDLAGVAGDWDPKKPPYLGLSAYREEHAAVFFGREEESGLGVELLERRAPGLIMVLGASGSGKSSLVRAGILPRLRRQPEHWLIVDPFRPGRDPFAELAESLARSYRQEAPDSAAEAGDRDRIRERLESGASALSRPAPTIEKSPPLAGDDRLQRLIEQLEGLRRDPPAPAADRLRDFLDWSLDDLRRICGPQPDAAQAMSVDATPLVEIAHELRRGSGRRNAHVVLVVDQLEELLGREEADDRAHRFLALLRASIEVEHGPLLCLGTMRSDFLGLFQRNAALRGIDFESLSLGPMQVDGMRRVIEQPARLGAIELEDGLADRLLEDTETADAFPLLSFTLSVLWRERRDEGKLTIRSYQELGGLQGAVAREADAILSLARRQGKEDDLRRALLRMARLAEDGTYARQPVGWSDDENLRVEPILDQLVERRLLVARGEGDSRIVEVAHEALFRSWEPLRAWLEDSRSELLLRQQLRRDAATWEESGRSADTLWRGGRLLQAKELLGSGPGRLGGRPGHETAFIHAGLRRQQRQRLTLISTTVVVIAFLTGFLLYALAQADRARKERAKALDVARVSVAGEQLEKDPTTAALILTEIDDAEETPFAKRRLSEVLVLPLIHAELGHDSPVADVWFSPDGHRVVTVTEDNTVHLWDAETGLPLAAMRHDEPVEVAQVSPDGKLVLTAAGSTTWLWDVESGEKRLAGPWTDGGQVGAASFSPDGKLVAAGYDDGTVWVRDLETGEPRLSEPWNLDGNVDTVRFSPDGKLVLAGNYNRARVWDLETGEEKSGFEAGGGDARFSPSGRFVVTTNRGDSVHVWSVSTGKERSPPLSHTPSPAVAEWLGPDDGLLLTASGHRYFSYWAPRADNLLRAWDLKTGELRFAKELRHGSEMMRAAFSPDGRFLATVSGTRHGGGRAEHLEAESTVRVWALATEGERFSLRLLERAAAFSPDGSLVATASGNAAQLWDVETGRAQLREPPAMPQPVTAVAFSPDGKMIVTESRQAAQLWDAATGRPHFAEPLSFPEPLGLGASQVSFTSNGRYLITEHHNGTVQAWDVLTGAPRFPEPPKFCAARVRPVASPDGKLLLSACGQTVELWDLETGRRRFPEPWSHDSGYVRSLDFSPDGRRALTASDDRTARVWDVETGSELHRLRHDDSAAYGVGEAWFSPDGRRVVTTSNSRTAHIWDAETGHELHPLEHPGGVDRAAFTADGRLVVTVYTGDDLMARVGVWDAESGEKRFEIPIGGRKSASWSLGPFGRYLVTWQEHSARLWHLETGEEVFSEPLGHRTGDVRFALFSPDGKRLLTATDKESLIWSISGELLQSAVRSATVACLSPGFRQRLGESYDDARAAYEACERGYGREPGVAVKSAP